MLTISIMWKGSIRLSTFRLLGTLSTYDIFSLKSRILISDIINILVYAQMKEVREEQPRQEEVR